MTPAARLRSLLAAPGILAAPGAYDALTAKLIEAAGFPVVYMTGYGTAAAHGHADVGILGLDEMSANAARIAAAVSVPVIADADTGYEDAGETMRRYIDAGVAGIQLEDQAWPKKCGHMEGKVLVPAAEMVQRIQSAVVARGEAGTVIVARTDAIAVEGFAAALERAAAYADAGADLLFIEAPETREQVEAIPRELPGLPHVYNIAPKSPSIPLDELEQLGYALAIYPGICFAATMIACRDALDALHASGQQENLLPWKENFAKWNRFLGGETTRS